MSKIWFCQNPNSVSNPWKEFPWQIRCHIAPTVVVWTGWRVLPCCSQQIFARRPVSVFSLFTKRSFYTFTVLSGVNLSRATITATASLSDHHAILSSQLPESLLWDLRLSRQCVQRNILLLITFWGVFLIFFCLITPYDSGLVQGDVWFRTKLDIEQLQCIVLGGV